MARITISRSFTPITQPLFRSISSNTIDSWVDLSVDKEGIALLKLNRPPVNSINLEFLQQIISTIETAQKDQVKGMVLTSETRIFSAGLDLNEMNNPDLKRLRTFWSKLQDLVLLLYGSGRTTNTVAINGYTAAGGCVISVMCDYRVMVSDSAARIGLNDTAVGIVPRPWLCEIMTQIMGHRQAEIALTASTMYTAEEALKLNLIDQTAIDKEDAIEKCKQFIRRYDQIPVDIKAKTKLTLREHAINLLAKNREEDINMFTEGIMNPNVQKQIATYVQNLKSKKEKKL